MPCDNVTSSAFNFTTSDNSICCNDVSNAIPYTITTGTSFTASLVDDFAKLGQLVQDNNNTPMLITPEIICAGILEHKRPVTKDVKIIKQKNGDPIGVVVFFADGTKQKAVCQKGDTFDLETGIAMCLLKWFYADNAEGSHGTKNSNNAIREVIKVMNDNLALEEKAKEEEQRIKRKQEKNRKRKQKRAMNQREARIQEMTEAIKRSRE